jgi:hypothetical protein
MAELKTKPTAKSPAKFIQSIDDEQERKDSRTLMKIMKEATGASAKMWGPSMVGYGKYHYKYASGREGDWFMVGFSPRKQALTVYLMGGLDKHQALLRKLGKHSRGAGCLYIKRLEHVDMKVLETLIHQSVSALRSKGV